MIILPTLFLLASCADKREEIKKPMQQSTDSVKMVRTASGILEGLKKNDQKTIQVVSHRADWRYAPENSIMAIQRCIDLGVDVIELDFRLTKDGHLIAMHDETVDRTTNGSGRIGEMSLTEIKALRLKNGCGAPHTRQQVPTLEEIMQLVKGKIMVNLDKTESKWVREAYEVLKKTNTVDHAIFKGNDDLETMRKKYGSLMDSIIYMPKLWYKYENAREFRRAFENDIDPFMYETLFDTEEAETFTMIPQMKREGDSFLAIALWDELCAGRTDEVALLDGPEESWGWLIANGADAIMTDRPEELLAYLRKKGLHD